VGTPAKFYILLGLVVPLSNNFLKRESTDRQDLLLPVFYIFCIIFNYREKNERCCDSLEILYTKGMKQFSVHSEIGILGEKLAKRFLEKRGHRVIAENYYFEKGKRSGEIDVITVYKGIFHFIEVKTRHIKEETQKSRALYFPIASQVTPAKIRKCVRTAEHYLRSQKMEEREYHFDLVTVLYNSAAKKAEIEYLPDIFY
jgi:putative endonuclease